LLPASVFHGIVLATEGLLIYFLPVEENRLITLHRPVILFIKYFTPSGLPFPDNPY
jgi:hypothetical protein